MKKKTKRVFKSWDEIEKAYLPKRRARAEAAIPDDPEAAGRKLGEQVVETMRSELARRLQRK